MEISTLIFWFLAKCVILYTHLRIIALFVKENLISQYETYAYIWDQNQH
jgi:hypothetical protein